MAKERGYIISIIVLVAAFVTIYWLYVTYLKKEELPPINGDYPEPPPEADIWTWNYPGGPTLVAEWIFNQYVFLSSLQGRITIDELPDGFWQKGIGYRIYAITPTRWVEIFKGEPYGGYNVGEFPFESNVAVNDVIGLRWEVTRWYGFGGEMTRIFDITALAVVVV